MNYIANLARLDPSEKYRYWLFRQWADRESTCCFVMLNPSTADAYADDATIRRCVGFAKLWGHSALSVVNLYAYRTHNPKRLREPADPIGPENDRFILSTIQDAARVVFAWGSSMPYPMPPRTIGVALEACEAAGIQPQTLGVTKQGIPRHPLYLRADTPLQLLTPE